MNFGSTFFWPSDRAVEWLHGLIGIPWEESVNRHIPFGLPNQGLDFPLLLGRLVYLGVLAGILICLLSLISGKRRLTIKEKKKSDPMLLYLLPSALCLWGEYFLIREFFFAQENLLNNRVVTNMVQAFGQMFRGLFSAQIVVDGFLGIAVFVLALLALVVLLVLPAICYGSLRGTHGRLAPFYLVMHLGFQCAALALLIIGLYYAVATGFAETVLINALELIGLAVSLYLLYWMFMYGLAAVSTAVKIVAGVKDWRKAVQIVSEGVRRYGDEFTITVDTGVQKFELKGQRAVDYVARTASRFEK